MSFGTYIYHWPSKFDQVFWPSTDPKGLWFCSSSGFIALMGDFDNLSDAERANVASYLAHHKPSATPSLAEKLDLVEQLYALRTKDDGFRNRLLRVLAYMHEVDGDQAEATRLRMQALVDIRQALKADLPESQRLEYLFVSCAYEREFGDEERFAPCLKVLDDALAKSTQKDLAGYVEYLTKLKAELVKIAPGGQLAPLGDEP
jgi:hypothetical protein